MKTIDNAIIEKLKKILALANDHAAQPGEVEAALAKAKALAIQHNLELSAIDLSTNDKASAAIQVEHDASLKTTRFEHPYHRYIFSLFQKLFGVRVILTSHRPNGCGNKVIDQIHLVGEVTDIAVVKALFPYLTAVFPATLRTLLNAGYPNSAPTINGCYLGLYQGIVAANRREEEKLTSDQQTSYALVVRRKEDLVEAKIAATFSSLKDSQSRERRHDWGAHAAGYQKGKQINLRQVEGVRAESCLKN